MATFSGQIQHRADQNAENPNLSATLTGGALARWSTLAPKNVLPGDIEGPLTNNLTVDPLSPKVFTGERQHATFDDFYNRIHVRPSTVALGAVVSETSRQIEVWNAYLALKEMQSISGDNPDTLTLEGLVPPFTLDALEATAYVLRVPSAGAPVIDATFTFEFPASTRNPTLEITGRRLIEFPMEPNWADPVEQTLSYKTEIITAKDGTEQRIALRHLPRRHQSFAYVADGPRYRRMQRALATWQNRTFAVPNWPRYAVTDGVSPGSSVVQVQGAVPAEIKPDSLASVRHGDTSEMLEVLEVSDTTVTFRAPFNNAYPAGTRLYPAEPAMLTDKAAMSRLTSRVGTGDITFRSVYEAGTLVDRGAPDQVWEGLEVWPHRPNWAESIDQDSSFPVEWLDTGRGAFDSRVDALYQTLMTTYTFLAVSRDDVRWLEAFFHRMRGRRGTFWAPSYGEDLVEAGSGLDANTFTLWVKDGEMAAWIADDPVIQALEVLTTDGVRHLQRITNANKETDDLTSITVSDPWPRRYEPSEVLSIRFLYRCRLGADELVVRWLTDEVADTALTFVTLEAQ